MEEVNEMALAELVDTSILQPDIDFDFQTRGFSKEIEEDILVMRCENNEADAKNILIKGRNFKRVKEYCKSTNNEDINFEDCMQKVFNTKAATSKKYIMCYDTLMDIKKKVSRETFERILQLGIHKISYFSAKIPENVKIKMLESAPLETLNVEQTRQLTNKVKETGEYNEDLLNEIRQKDDKIKTSEAQTQQLQQEKEQKDQEIAELKAKLQKMEEDFQPVGKVEPEIVEKIVEVEKVVEKEVIPYDIKEELENLRSENEALVKDNKDKSTFIQEQNTTIVEQRQKLNNLKIDDTIPEDTIPAMKLGSLLSFIDCFLRDTSGFTLLKGQFSEISDKSKQTLLNSIARVEDWCVLMKQAVDNDKTMLGKNIIIESEND